MSSGVVVQQKEERESGEIAQWAKHMLNKADLDLSLHNNPVVLLLGDGRQIQNNNWKLVDQNERATVNKRPGLPT